MQDTIPWVNYVCDSETNHSGISHLEQVFAVFSAVVLYMDYKAVEQGISTFPENTLPIGACQKAIRYETIYNILIISE